MELFMQAIHYNFRVDGFGEVTIFQKSIRLGEISAGPKFLATLRKGHIRCGGKDDDGNVGKCLVRFHILDDVIPVSFGHIQIGQNNFW